MVEWDKKKKKFHVTVHDRAKDRMYTEEFDNVICASGHFSTPHVPFFEGLDTFNGRVLHAHDFRDALEFKGKDVLIVGRSYSAEDIGSQCWKYGAKSVTTTYRSKPMGFKWPENFEERPLLQKARRQDGALSRMARPRRSTPSSCAPATSTISRICRRTCASRPPTACGRKISTRAWSGRTIRSFFYIGMQDQFYTFNMFDAQAWYVRDIILGRIKLPKADAMKKDWKKWLKREEKLADAEQMIWFQGDYVKELIEATDYPSFDIESVNKTFMDWEHHKMDDIMGFRNNSYRSLMTGTMSPKHHTPWKDELDDSMEAYLKNG